MLASFEFVIFIYTHNQVFNRIQIMIYAIIIYSYILFFSTSSVIHWKSNSPNNHGLVFTDKNFG